MSWVVLLWLACSGQQAVTGPGLRAPFEGARPMVGVFDHASPGRRGHQLAASGEWTAGESGHLGYDWAMPLGTPILAAHAGRVIFAGVVDPFFCALTGQVVEDQLAIRLLVDMDDGSRLVTSYAHLSEVRVERNQRVVAGERIGLSGNTGCSTGPHLHFSAERSGRGSASKFVPVDPYGWQGAGQDPYASRAQARPVEILWGPDAPPLRPRDARP